MGDERRSGSRLIFQSTRVVRWDWVVTFSNDARRKGSFDILVDGKKVGGQETERRSPEQDVRFFDVEYSIPAGVSRRQAESDGALRGFPSRERYSRRVWDSNNPYGRGRAEGIQWSFAELVEPPRDTP